MYKILIAEDEWLTRNSLINAIDWRKVNCEVVAGAQDGNEALKYIEELNPEIVISDIKMDEMDGLELCQHISEDFPDIKMILITGYNEFEYAQKAIKLGVKDFISKPTDPDKLLSAVEIVVQEIELNKMKQAEFARLQKIVEDNIPLLREKFVLELANGIQFDTVEICRKQEFLGMDCRDFHVMVIEIDDYDVFINSYDEKHKQVIKLMIRGICEQAAKENGYGLFVEKETNLFLMCVQCSDVTMVAEYIQQRIMDITEISVSIGISLPAPRVDGIMLAYEQAVEALKYKFYIGKNCILSYQDLERNYIYNNALPFTHVNSIIDGIVEAVKIGDSAGALGQVNSLFDDTCLFNREGHNYIRNIAFEITFLLQRFLLYIGEEPRIVFNGKDYYIEISNCKTLEDIKRLLEKSIIKVADLVHDRNSKISKSVVDKIIEYLSSNYSNEITLDDLGKVVYMNPKYVCRLIKKETGTNFSDILLDIRIEKAKELLRDPGLKAFEIAEMVGIKDSRYFSKVFKKAVGVTLTDYKQQFT